MNKKMFELMQRRGELLANIAVQREQVAATVTRWHVPLSVADKCFAVVHFFSAKPMLVAGAVAMVVFRRRGLTGLAVTGWRIWKLYKSARSFSAKIAS